MTVIKTNLTSYTATKTHAQAIRIAEELTLRGYEVGKVSAVRSRRQYNSKADYHSDSIWQIPVNLYITREASKDQQKFLVELSQFREYLAAL